MENETKFVNGLRVFMPHEKAPDFVKLNFLADAQELADWLLANKDEEGKIKFDLLKSQKGNLYLKHNDYKKPQPSNNDYPRDKNDELPIDPDTDPALNF